EPLALLLMGALPVEPSDVLPEPLPPSMMRTTPLLLPEPLLVAPMPGGVPVEQPVAYAAVGTARNAMSPRPRLNFTSILPWRGALGFRALPSNPALPVLADAPVAVERCASTQTPPAKGHFNVCAAAPDGLAGARARTIDHATSGQRGRSGPPASS